MVILRRELCVKVFIAKSPRCLISHLIYYLVCVTETDE